MSEEAKSYNQMRDDFFTTFKKQCLPILKGMETERKKLYFCFIILLPLAIISFILMFFAFFTKEESLIPFIPIMIIFTTVVFIIYKFLTKNFENKVKSRIMPTLCEAIGNINWRQNPPISHDLYINSYILYRKFDKVEVDDVFNGSYKGINYNIVEACYSKKEIRHTKNGTKTEYVTIFNGLLITLDMNKKFNSHTVIKPNMLGRFLANSELKHTVLEDTEFEKKYDVLTNDEVEARYLLTPSFMERLKNIQMSFMANSTECAFYQDKLIIAIDKLQDKFHVGSIWKPLTDERQYFQMFEEILSIIKLIDHFKLDQKIGL